MTEALDPWPYVVAAFALGLAATAALLAWSGLAMARAEARRERSRGR